MREAHRHMHRPIGVTILAVLAGLAGLLEIWRTLVFLGIAKFTFVGTEVAFKDPQWGQAFFAILLAGIWFWVAAGFWNVRAYAWSFGTFIAMFTLIFGFFAVLGQSTLEAEFAPMFIAFVMFFYLNYPGVRDQFMKHELELMTPEQRAAFDQMQAAQMAMAKASVAPAPAAPAPATPPAPPAPPAPPPAAAPPAATATRRGPRSTIERPTCDAGRPFSCPRGQSRRASTSGERSTSPHPDPRRRRATRRPAPSGTTSPAASRTPRCAGCPHRGRPRAC